MKRILKAGSVDRSRLTAARLARYGEAFSDPRRAAAALAYYRQIFRSLLDRGQRARLKDYPPLRAPFRLVWGDQDIALSIELLDGMERFFEGPYDVVHLPEHGHFTPLEAPDEVGRLTAKFLAGR